MTRIAAFVLALVCYGGCDGTTPPSVEHRHGAETATAPRSLYQCPMHPQIIRTEPGSCPICGMTLQRVDEMDAAPPGVPGHASFVLTPERQQLIGVMRTPVVVRPLTIDLRAAAIVADDGALYQALIEYRETLRTRGILRTSPSRVASSGGDALVAAAALKLRRLGLAERELMALRDLDPTTFILPGPSVWVYAQVFEEDAAIITPGMPITIDVPADPGTSFATTVFSIDPTVNPETRTVRVRARVTTPHENLRPGTFVTATLHIPLGEQIAIPRSAVLPSGTHRLVFVVAPDGRFTPRDVELGRVAGDYYEVRTGLTAGEDVVTSANFLIDSESRFKAALKQF